MVSTHDLAALARARTPCVSIYLPTHRHGPGTVTAANHLRGLLKHATKELGARAVSATVADATISPIRAICDHDGFWQQQREGLAVFASSNFWAHYSLPRPPREQVVVNDIFFMRQLIPFRDGEETYHVLALNKNGCALYRGDRESFLELTVPDMPDSIADALRYEDPESQLQFRSAGSGTAIFHGHGLGDELDKESMERYFRHVDKAVSSILDDPTIPLVLAGVGHHIPIFRSVTALTNITEGFVEGSVERRSAQEIHAVSWEVVREKFDRPRNDKIERYSNALGTGLTLDNLPDILEAATEGRVDTLFVGDTSVGVDEVSESYLNATIKRCVTSGGRVYEAPIIVAGPERACALLRY